MGIENGKTFVIGSFNIRKLSKKTSTFERAKRIAAIILHEGMDIVALQEVFNGKEALNPILQYLGPNWDYAWQPSTIAKHNYLELVQNQPDYDQFGEGLAFIWDRNRLNSVSKPNICEGYQIYDQNLKPLVRNPLYGRFSPAGCNNACNFELRLLNVHIRFNGKKEDIDPGYIRMRKNEFVVLNKCIYPYIANRSYGNNAVPYTIIAGDYNLNTERAWNKSPYLDEPLEGYFAVGRGTNEKKIITVQACKTTLKVPPSEGEEPNHEYANNFDHMTYDDNKFYSMDPKCYRVDIMNDPYYQEYSGKYDKYFSEVSDHIPIVLKFNPTGNS